MRARALLAVLGVVALAALALGRAPSSRPPGSRVGGRGAAAPAPEPSTLPVDPAGIRDLFRFADELPPVAGPARRPSASSGDEPLSSSSSTTGLRLVGLLHRGGRLVAALAKDGEVEIAGPGEAAAGVTVLSVGEDRVRVRRADGREETLVLP